MESEDRLFESLAAASAGAVRLELETIQRVFSATFPALDGSPDRRFRLREMLDALSARGAITSPADQKRGWQHRPAPALPNFVRLIRAAADKPERFDHRSFPWAVPELGFVASLPILNSPEDTLRIHEFFKNSGAKSPVVPSKERSWQIFQDEKRLDTLRGGQLFGEGRLTLDLLRCRDVTQILAFCPSPTLNHHPILIVENEATFHSFSRLNDQLGLFAGVVFGSGNCILKATDYLRELGRTAGPTGSTTFLYFGDLDATGLRIGRQLSDQLRQFGICVGPAETYYAELFRRRNRTVVGSPEHVDEKTLAWCPERLRFTIATELSQLGRIPQEALGWESLCALHGGNSDGAFALGFPGFGMILRSTPTDVASG